MSGKQANLPGRLGISPKKTHSETDISSDAKTVSIALSAKPHLDLTISILPALHTIIIIITLETKCISDQRQGETGENGLHTESGTTFKGQITQPTA